jgi:hypothetical protein
LPDAVSLTRAPSRLSQGFIKDYDGGTLMECKINERINYLDVQGTVQRQRAAVQEKIKSFSSSHVVHDGIKAFREGKSLEVAEIPGMCVRPLLHGADGWGRRGGDGLEAVCRARRPKDHK